MINKTIKIAVNANLHGEEIINRDKTKLKVDGNSSCRK